MDYVDIEEDVILATSCLVLRGVGKGGQGGHAPPRKFPCWKIKVFWITHYCDGYWRQLQGASPPDPHQGSAPGPHWENCVPSSPVLSPPKQISGYAPVSAMLRITLSVMQWCAKVRLSCRVVSCSFPNSIRTTQTGMLPTCHGDFCKPSRHVAMVWNPETSPTWLPRMSATSPWHVAKSA